MTSRDKWVIRFFFLFNTDAAVTLAFLLCVVGLCTMVFYNILVGLSIFVLVALGLCTNTYLTKQYVRIMKR